MVRICDGFSRFIYTIYSIYYIVYIGILYDNLNQVITRVRNTFVFVEDTKFSQTLKVY